MHILDYTMPGIKKFNSWNESNGRDKLSDFVERYWHFDNITGMTKSKFIDDYVKWAAEKKYHQNRSKAAIIYDLASDGIPTLSANTPSTKMLILEAVSVILKWPQIVRQKSLIRRVHFKLTGAFFLFSLALVYICIS